MSWEDFKLRSKDHPFKKLSPKKRGDKYYVTIEGHDLAFETNYRKMFSWLRMVVEPYGWKPHLTSGGLGSFTFRLNGDLS